MFKKQDKGVTLDLPPEPPKLHEVTGSKGGELDGELLPRHLKPHHDEHHELPPLPDLDDDLPELEPLSTGDHGLKTVDDLKLDDLPPLPSPEDTLDHDLPEMPKPPVHHTAPHHFPKPSEHHDHFPKPPAHHEAPHFPKPPVMPPMPKPPVHPDHIPNPQAMPPPKPMRTPHKAIQEGPSFGDLFPEDHPAMQGGAQDKIIRDDAAFLSVLSFERVLGDMQTSREDLKRIHHYVSDISGYVGDEDKAYASFREDIIDIQQRLAKMDKVLFTA
jgi:hypothetical protein